VIAQSIDAMRREIARIQNEHIGMFDACKIFPYGRLHPSYKAQNKFLSEIT
jgi:hypothetical protein